MQKPSLPILIFSAFLGLAIVSSLFFTIDQRQYAVVFQFGEAMRVITKPGLNIKVPFIQNVEYFDNRLLSIDAEAKELTASDEKRIIVDAFAEFKITDPITFYKTVHNYQGLRLRLNKIIEASMRKVIGRVPLTTLLSGERSNVMMEIHDLVNSSAKNFGIDVIDVRILRTDLPKENSAGIYSRMQTDREKEAKQIRAEGEEEAARIRAKAEKESKIIIAEAYRNGQITKGEGDKAAALIYNDVYSKDPEFFKFYKSLMTYRNTLKKEDTTFILSPNSEALKFLNMGK
ncbi:MAG: protease modulator HflC [Pseudomonadota bacterium]